MGFTEVLQNRLSQSLRPLIGANWERIRSVLDAQRGAWASLEWMEDTGGTPDLFHEPAGTWAFYDTSEESPQGRRSVCWDEKARLTRKEHAPESSAWGLAHEQGLEILSESQYRFLQNQVSVDQKTSSWLDTPPAVRALGGALFGDRRYGQVFIYHNGAESYYASRGFRCRLELSLELD